MTDLLENIRSAAKTDSRRPATGVRPWIYRLLEAAQDDDVASRIVDIGLIALIAASVVAVILESIPAIEERYGADGFGPSMYISDPDGNIVELKGPPVRGPIEP